MDVQDGNNFNLSKKRGLPMFDTVKNFVGSKAGVITALGALVTSSAFAEEAVTLPETGINVSGYATTAISSLGAVAAVAVGGYVAFLLVRKGLSWIRKI